MPTVAAPVLTWSQFFETILRHKRERDAARKAAVTPPEDK